MITQFAGNLSSSLEVGQILVISGKTIDDASRLDINLASGKQASQMPLHLSVRFYEDMIVRNSLIDGVGWGAEEREDNLDEFTTTNPIIPGDNFKIYILAGDSKFHIAINDRHYCTYEFRTALSEIRSITINKDVQTITQIDHRQAYPIPFPIVQCIDKAATFSNDVPRPFVSGHVIIITAIPYGNPKGMFIMSFYEGETKKQALHFNARFEPTYTVVRNAMNDTLDFGREERYGGFPFVIDQQFKLAIALTDHEFRFGVNGEFFTSFGYRNPELLNTLNGFKLKCVNGMQLEVTSVDHMNTGIPECEGFESYSHPDVQIF